MVGKKKKKIALSFLFPFHSSFPWKILKSLSGSCQKVAWSNCCSLNSKQTKPFHQIPPISKSSDYLHFCPMLPLCYVAAEITHFPIHTCIGMKTQALQTRAPCLHCMEQLTTNSFECSFAEMLEPVNFWPGQDFLWAAFLCYSMKAGVRLETAQQMLSNQEDMPYASC